jgi:RHS repeat-associated protein
LADRVIPAESGLFPTDRRFTGQRWEQGLGLYDYRARFYDPTLGRFLQPDPLVPELGNPQALNRYAYVYSNPLRYTDPSGHAACIDEGCALLAPPGNPRPFLRVPAPRAITFIHREMVRNAQSKIATAIHMANAIAQWPLCPGCVLGGKTLAFTLWTSQVMGPRSWTLELKITQAPWLPGSGIGTISPFSIPETLSNNLPFLRYPSAKDGQRLALVYIFSISGQTSTTGMWGEHRASLNRS